MIRSSLESKIYILQGSCPAYQFDNAGAPVRVAAAGMSPNSQRLKTALLMGAAFLVLGWLFYRVRSGSFQWDLFRATLYRIQWFWLAFSIVLTLLSYLGRAWRWEVMLRPLGATASIRQLTYDTSVGFTAVALLGRAGEIVRPYLISVSAGVSFSSQVAAWILERILDLLAVLLLFGFALARIPAQGMSLGPGLRWVFTVGGYLVAAIGVALLLFFVLFRNFSAVAERRILAALTFLPRNYYNNVESMLRAFSQGMESTRDARCLTLLIFYTVVEWALIIGCYYTLFLSFPLTAHLTIIDVVIIIGFIAFGSLVQIPGIGGGVQIISVVVLTEIYHLPLEAASAVAVFIWIITFVVIVPLGLFFAFRQGLNWNKLKHLQKEASR